MSPGVEPDNSSKMPESFFKDVPLGPEDPLLGTFVRYINDTDPRKVNLGVGAYRDEEGEPVILSVVHKAEERLMEKLKNKSVNKEYNRIDGLPGYMDACQKVVFGLSEPDPCIASVQSLSGTGALRLCAEFIGRTMPQIKMMYISNPTWGLEKACFELAGGIKQEMYPYWDPANKTIEIEPLLDHLRKSPAKSLYVLQPGAHNPTGMDPSFDQWKQILDIVMEKEHLVILDSAYQGYASGDLVEDRQVMELFYKSGVEFIVCQSFSKSMGLYGERIGCLHFRCKDETTKAQVLSQLKISARAMYSNPPIHGALIVKEVLEDPELFLEWKAELAAMAGRIKGLRSQLREGLEKKGTPCSPSWAHITNQIGMFSFTGLTEKQCDMLIEKHHIYLMRSGRISVAGLNQGNIQYVVDAFDDVVRNC